MFGFGLDFALTQFSYLLFIQLILLYLRYGGVFY